MGIGFGDGHLFVSAAFFLSSFLNSIFFMDGLEVSVAVLEVCGLLERIPNCFLGAVMVCAGMVSVDVITEFVVEIGYFHELLDVVNDVLVLGERVLDFISNNFIEICGYVWINFIYHY